METAVTPVPVKIGNLAELGQEIRNSAQAYAKPRMVKNTSVKTYVIDAAGVNPGVLSVQIAAYEPNRVRMAVFVQLSTVSLTMEAPIASPDVVAPTGIPQGAYLKQNDNPYEFFGPDAFWLNSILGQAATPVVVVKEYC